MNQAGKDQNPFHAPIKSEGAGVPVEQHRAVQEVQAAMVIAKKFPRDQHAAYSRIMAACERPSLAEAATFDFPRGKTMITGPTIRIAEVMGQNWGNLDFGIKELSQDGNGSEVQAFCWDLETNVRQSKTFVVPHKMKARGSFKTLTDPRDIYEHVANMGARRLRACILGIIPGDIVDAAVKKCEETLTKGDGKPIEDRVRDMLARFKEIEVSQELIEQRLQHKTTAIVRSQLVELGKIYNSIKDGMSKRSDWFDVPKSQQNADASDLTEKIKQNEKPEAPCPYCQVENKLEVIAVLEEGKDRLNCLHCEKECRIENGKLVGSYDPGATARNSEKLKCDHPDCTFETTSSAGLKKHKTQQGHHEKPKVDDPEDALLDQIATFPEASRNAISAALELDGLGRPWNVSELKAVLKGLLSPEGEQLKAVTIEINKYPGGTVNQALENKGLPSNRHLGLDESNLLLAECQRLTDGTGEGALE